MTTASEPRKLSDSLRSSKSVEWYTPESYLALVREFFGGDYFDPCPRPDLRPDNWDGLSMRWLGGTFMNPPYGRQIKRWIDKALAERVEIVMLVPARTDTIWFIPLWKYTLLFIRGRVHYISPDGITDPPFYPSVFVYVGPNVDEFRATFGHLGEVITERRSHS